MSAAEQEGRRRARHAPLGATVRKAAVSGTRSSKQKRTLANAITPQGRTARCVVAPQRGPGEAVCVRETATMWRLLDHIPASPSASGPAETQWIPSGRLADEARRSDAGPPSAPRRLGSTDGRRSNLQKKRKDPNLGKTGGGMTIAQLEGLEEQLRRRPDDASTQLKIGGSPPRACFVLCQW